MEEIKQRIRNLLKEIYPDAEFYIATWGDGVLSQIHIEIQQQIKWIKFECVVTEERTK